MSFCTSNTSLTLSGQFLGVKVFLLCKASLPFLGKTARYSRMGEGKGLKYTSTGIKLHSEKKAKCKKSPACICPGHRTFLLPSLQIVIPDSETFPHRDSRSKRMKCSVGDTHKINKRKNGK
jgi:hypothetical protein